MRKLSYIILLTALTFAHQGQAQSGKTVREGVMWNYSNNLEGLDGEIISSENDPGYHFKGNIEKEGKAYMQFMNGRDECVALLREDDSKVYLYIEPEWRDSLGDILKDSEGNTASEMLLYDFGADVGESYTIVSFSEPSMSGLLGCLPVRMTVTDAYTVNVGGEEMRAQTLESFGYERTLVEGVGPDSGLLSFPQPAWTNTGMRMTFGRLQTVVDTEGNEAFTGNDFPPLGNIVREDCSWDYTVTESAYGQENVYDDCGYRFKGYKEIDGMVYRRLVDGNGREVAFMRERHAWVYLYLDEEMRSALYGDVEDRPSEIVLYDFYAPTEDFGSVRFDCSQECNPRITNISILESEYIKTEKRYYLMRTVAADGEERYRYAQLAGTDTGWLHKPQFRSEEPLGQIALLKCVRDRHGAVLFESSDFGTPDGVGSVVADCSLRYDGTAILSKDSDIVVYDLSGKMMAQGHGEVSTASLLPGVYVARAGGKSLKIIVRN